MMRQTLQRAKDSASKIEEQVLVCINKLEGLTYKSKPSFDDMDTIKDVIKILKDKR
jgi:hypothetical protein